MENFPTEEEFDRFLEEEELISVVEQRPDLYLYLCSCKWRQWKADAHKWVPIRNWQAFAIALNDTIEDAMEY